MREKLNTALRYKGVTQQMLKKDVVPVSKKGYKMFRFKKKE